MAGKVKQALEKEVTCPLCLDLFKEPKKLSCDHVYCKDCLKGLALRSLNQSISCPECRTNTNVPNGNVNDFPTAFRMNRLIEAFHEAQEEGDYHGEESTDGPTSCTVHPAQPLALYCETCKTTLCRDCVIMNKDHQHHNYDYIDKVAEKCREKYANRLQKTKEYGELSLQVNSQILKVEGKIESEETLKREEIDRAFAALHNTLEENKRMMKRELTQQYQAAKDTLLHHKCQAANIQIEVSNITELVEKALQCKNGTLVTQDELIENKFETLQKQIEQLPLSVKEPLLPVPQVMDTETLQEKVNTSNFFYTPADPKKCVIKGSFLTNAEIGKSCVLTMDMVDSNGDSCLTIPQKIEAHLRCTRDNTIIQGTIQHVSQLEGKVTISFEPQIRGRMELTVAVRGQHIANSPKSTFVHMPPTQLGKPVAEIHNLRRPCGLTHFGNGILAVEEFQNRLLKINSSFKLAGIFREGLQRPSELTTYKASNVYVTTELDHMVHKFTREGRHTRSIGGEGKQPGEFDFPNGLCVNSREELYVCDSLNNRIQVFDLDLNFKREFGGPGTGKEQFSFPADVAFDSNDNIYISDKENHRIQVFTPQEHFVRFIRHKKLNDPLNMCIINDFLFVTDVKKCRIVVLKTSGEFVTTIGDGTLDYPEGIQVDQDGYVYVTSHRSKIVVY